MSEAEPESDAVLALIARIGALRPDLEPLDAGLVAALHLGLAADSRTYAKVFGLAHAHALRALVTTEEAGLVAVERREARTQRTRYRLTEDGRTLLASAAPETRVTR